VQAPSHYLFSGQGPFSLSLWLIHSNIKYLYLPLGGDLCTETDENRLPSEVALIGVYKYNTTILPVGLFIL